MIFHYSKKNIKTTANIFIKRPTNNVVMNVIDHWCHLNNVINIKLLFYDGRYINLKTLASLIFKYKTTK